MDQPRLPYESLAANKHARFMLRMRLSLNCGCTAFATQGVPDNLLTVELLAACVGWFHGNSVSRTAYGLSPEIHPVSSGLTEARGSADSTLCPSSKQSRQRNWQCAKDLQAQDALSYKGSIMMRLTIILVMLGSILCSLRAQQPPGGLIGTTDLKQLEQHLYAVAFPIVQSVAKAKSNLVSRILISKVTKSDCCNPICIGGDCFQCCDNPNHIICTTDVAIGYILGRVNAVSKSEWEEAQSSEFRTVEEWIPISSLLLSYPIRELPAKSPEALEFWRRMKP
jgi:hypothetical protein